MKRRLWATLVCAGVSAVPARTAAKEWGQVDPELLNWNTRYGASLLEREDDSAFYVAWPRFGMWTSVEHRWKQDGLYLGSTVQVGYEFSEQKPFGQELYTELIAWDALFRMNAGWHWQFKYAGLFVYGLLGGGAQNVRARVWSPLGLMGEASAWGHELVGGAGITVSFAGDRLELAIELGGKSAQELELQHGAAQSGGNALLLPDLDLSAMFGQLGLGLAF